MLYDPARHLPFTESAFSVAKLLDTIRAVVAQADAGFDKRQRLWPIHPKDRNDRAPEYLTNFYNGAAGVIWAAHELAEVADVDLSEWPSIDEVLREHLQREDPYPDAAFIGQLGIRFVKQRTAPSDENYLVLNQLIRQAAANPCHEILFGGPGALAMAHILWRGGDPRFRTVCAEVAQAILDQREVDELSSARIWSQRLGTFHRKFIGAAHGTVGNWGVLLRVLRDLGNLSENDGMMASAEKFLQTYAKVEGEHCNWPRCTEGDEYADLTVVHWCHGATGILTDLACEIPVGRSQALDALFLKAANLIWSAGPLKKGVSLCHGTAGSGLALLKMFERTQDEVWLMRARALASFAVDQYSSELDKFGHARFSLWTGDLGMAIFLRDVLRGQGCLPGVAPAPGST